MGSQPSQMLGTPVFSSVVVVVVVVVVVLLYRPAHAQNSAPGLAFSLVFLVLPLVLSAALENSARAVGVCDYC